MVRILLTPRMIVVASVMLAAALGLFLMSVGPASGQEPYPGETPTVEPTVVEPYVGTPEATATPEATGAPAVPPATGVGTSGGDSQSAPLIAIGSAIGLAAAAVLVWRIASRPHQSS